MAKIKKSSTKKTAPSKVDFKEICKKFSLNFKKIKFPKFKNMESMKAPLKIIGMVALVIISFSLIDLAVQYLNNDYSVAVVNGTRISKSLWNDRLQVSYGSAVATQLIEEQIIKAEGKKANVSISKEEIDAEINKIIESIGGQEMFESALVANNITLEGLKDQIKIDLLSTKILAPTLVYTEDDVKEFFNQYSDVIFPNETAALETGAMLDFETYKAQTEETYIQQQVQTKRTTWLTEKKAEYKIQDNSTAKPKYGFLTITTNIVNNLLEKFGKTSK